MKEEPFYYHGEPGMRTTEMLAHYLLDFDPEVAIVESRLKVNKNELGETEAEWEYRSLEVLDLSDLRLLATAYLEKIKAP